MTVLNKIFIGFSVVLALTLGVTYSLYEKEKNKADRMQSNYIQMNNNNRKLSLKLSELDDKHKAMVDSLSEIIDEKPKEIIRYTNVYIKDTIIDTVYVSLNKESDTTYTFLESKDCFTVGGNIYVKDSIPSLTITKLEYNNDITYIVYLERQPWTFLWIETKLFGKKEANLEVISDCGSVTVEDVELIKE